MHSQPQFVQAQLLSKAVKGGQGLVKRTVAATTAALASAALVAQQAQAVTNFTTDASNVGSGVWMIATLAVVIVGVIAVAFVLGSQQGKFAKGIELFVTVVAGVLIVGQLTSWAEVQGAGRAGVITALFAGIPGQTGTTTSAFSVDGLDSLMN